MNRPTKFKCWDKKRQMMGDVTYIRFSRRGNIVAIGAEFNPLEEQVVKPEDVILIQFTGLYDRGVGIYEGDIVELKGFWKRIVEWGEIDDPELGDCIGYGYDECYEAGKIIGNIYENPELLK